MSHQDRLSSLEDLYGSILFARGFLLCREHPVWVPGGWATADVGDGFRLHHDPRVPLHRLRDERTELILIGDAFDLREPGRGNGEVARHLFRALGRSARHLHERTDWVHGRFALIYRHPDEHDLRILHDATGMRAVFHTVDGRWIGSHASLVAVNCGSEWQQRPTGRFGAPGRTTPYREVVLLVPNHELPLGSGRIARFFPRSGLERRPSGAVAEQAVRLLRSALDGIVARHPHPVASLTAGLDSRTTLAVSRQVADMIRFFTYYRGDDRNTDQADRAVAQRMAVAFGLRHEVLVTDDYPSGKPESFTLLCREHSYYPHLRRMAFIYSKHFDPDQDVHIRSNLSEVGRSFYRKVKHIAGPLRSGYDLARVYTAFSREISDTDLFSITGDFEDYFDATSFARVDGLRDTRDMLYWEHRMGAWHALVVLESDPAFQTYSLFNARAILDLLMSAPEEDRVAGEHMKQIIASSWPECLDFPINPSATRPPTP